MAAVRSGHGRCADLESRLLSGERWIYVDQQSLLKSGRSEDAIGTAFPQALTLGLPWTRPSRRACEEHCGKQRPRCQINMLEKSVFYTDCQHLKHTSSLISYPVVIRMLDPCHQSFLGCLCLFGGRYRSNFVAR